MSRKDTIFELIREKTVEITDMHDLLGWSASELELESGFSRNNISRDLNALSRELKVIKINQRPVLFFANIWHIETVDFASITDFLEMMSPNHLTEEVKKEHVTPSDTSKKFLGEVENAFYRLIGFDKSMKHQVKQAVASVMYPPKGLDTLLIGESGVGKSLFAEIMYDFTKETKKIEEKAPFVVFNCADYSSNSQLLLSHLFGHVEGAFTGATEEKKGIVDYANNGVLFLDEVHRLPPEGQEMLFSIMDHGKFRRLGESSVSTEVNIRIIAATTEDPKNAMLHTFLRRIPNIVEIPSLRDRSLEERMELIDNCFTLQSKKINKEILVSNEVMKFLLLYDCHHNVGQLFNDIQLICASAFIEMLTKDVDTVRVKLSQIPSQYVEYFDLVDSKRDHVIKEFINMNQPEVVFNPSGPSPSHLETYFVDKKIESNFYKDMESISKFYFEEGLEMNEVQQLLDEEVLSFFKKSDYLKYFQNNSSENPIYKIVSRDTYEFLMNTIYELLNSHAINFDEKSIIGLILHLNGLIERIQEKQFLKKPKSELLIDNESVYYKMSQNLVSKIEEYKQVKIPNYEIGFIAIFFESLCISQSEGEVGILVITHGKVSKELADVANLLLKVDKAKYICMNLDDNVNKVLELATAEVEAIDEGKGVLLLVDMGSLTSFGDIITKNTGIPVKTVSMVSTLTVLEATRLSMMTSTNLEELKKSVDGLIDFTPKVKEEQFTDYRDSQKFHQLVNSALTFINTEKAISTLTKVFDSILERIEWEYDNALYVKFILHATCMLERVLKNDTYIYNNITGKMLPYLSLFNAVKEEFVEIDNIWGVNVPDSELAYMTEIFIFSTESVFERALHEKE